MKNYFITGTNTDVGKTFVTCKLLDYFNCKGYKTLGLKPIASDSTQSYGLSVNDDVLKLMNSSSIKLDYTQVNSYSFSDPISPDIAARLESTEIEMPKIIDSINSVANLADYCFIEGVGGWKVPISQEQFVSDIAICMKLPVIMVVPIELGSINHSILTIESIMKEHNNIIGWVANIKLGSYKDIFIQENIESIKSHIKIPLLAIYEQEKLIYDKLYML